MFLRLFEMYFMLVAEVIGDLFVYIVKTFAGIESDAHDLTVVPFMTPCVVT